MKAVKIDSKQNYEAEGITLETSSPFVLCSDREKAECLQKEIVIFQWEEPASNYSIEGRGGWVGQHLPALRRC